MPLYLPRKPQVLREISQIVPAFPAIPKAGLKSDAVDAEQLARRIAGHIEDGKIAHWQVRVKIGATLDD
jgi:flavin-binding protein dodecin